MLFVFMVSYADPEAASNSNPPSQKRSQNNASDAREGNNMEAPFQGGTEDEELKAKMQEQRKLELESALIRARLEIELADLRAEIEKMRIQREAAALKWELEQEASAKEHERQLLNLNRQKDKIMAEVALSQAKLNQTMEEFNKVYTNIQNQTLLLRSSIEHLQAEIDDQKVQRERKNYADGEPVYLEDPLLPNGTLVISDRSVTLNGVITAWKANYIVDRISYFNNKDKQKPIFIVIENSPGGGIMAGQRILQSMHNSEAPVYVVLKGFAASMSALITTLATKSYAYPNAMILHHQPWTFTIGNLRELKEEVAYMQEWWNRLGGQVAKKMGISLDKFDKLLYEKASRGDYIEFADNAKKIKWVDHVARDVHDTSLRELPDAANYTWQKYWGDYYGIEWSTREQDGKIYLPQLDPKDFYYLYNPDNLYQIRSSK
jgi:ATP-dependent Clp protease protease subunit